MNARILALLVTLALGLAMLVWFLSLSFGRFFDGQVSTDAPDDIREQFDFPAVQDTRSHGSVVSAGQDEQHS